MATDALKVEPSPAQLVVRCLVERNGDQWQAFSLDFGLAAQGDSEDEAKKKLDAMIVSYLHDALVGEDCEHAQELLLRKATWSVFVKYHFYLVSSYLTKYLAHSKNYSVYREQMPFAPKHCPA